MIRARFGLLLSLYLLILFASNLCAFVSASPFNPRVPPASFISSSYFIGWFLRLVDNENESSFAVIIGSLRLTGEQASDSSAGYDSHYVQVLHSDSAGKTRTFSAFPPSSSVSITCNGKRPKKRTDLTSDANFEWTAEGIGGLNINPAGGQLSIELPGVKLNSVLGKRRPWSTERPNGDGPEGWLAKTPFQEFLPLRYFVHSFGSETHYEITVGNSSTVTGQGLTHCETNYGNEFPRMWVWAQGNKEGQNSTLGSNYALEHAKTSIMDVTRTLAGGGESRSQRLRRARANIMMANSQGKGRHYFVLTGLPIDVGPILTTQQWVLAYRSDNIVWDFRTIDLDKVELKVMTYEGGKLAVTATSVDGSRRIEFDIQTPPDTFSDPIYIPTTSGWSQGAVESYSAETKIKCYELDKHTAEMKLIEEAIIPMSALEFGGKYVDNFALP